MPRTDLLSLSADDLATLANRGLVKRALAELDGGQIEGTPTENAAGTVSVLWSDDVHCLLPSGKTLREASCSCAATGICRHLIRSVLAYQRQHIAPVEVEIKVAELAASLEWNPGAISANELNEIVPAATSKRARQLWDAGQIIEVRTGARPVARFHTLGTNTRFLVANDARYTHCDCAQSAPCVHVPLAVWAFEKLAPGAREGLISTRAEPPTVPVSLLDSVEKLASELARVGVAHAGRPFLDKLARLESELRAGELMWPAAIVADLARQIEWHDAHNARFEAARVAQLVGELLIRADAIGAQTGATPDLFVRGAASDVTVEVGAARLIGIGADARIYGGGVEVRAFLQDADSGAVVFVTHDFPDPIATTPAFSRAPVAPAAPQSLARLAAMPVVKGVGLSAVGGGQILARGGKRAPSGAWSFGRSPLSYNAQNYQWEKLRAPLLAENFAEVAAHLGHQAPAFLRPRRAAENLFVVPIIAAHDARFDGGAQEIRAALRDAANGEAHLVHPFSARGAAGFEALLQLLQSQITLKFVAGRVEMGADGLTIAPLALVYEADGKRHILLPWLAEVGVSAQAQTPVAAQATSAPDDPLRDWQRECDALLGETWLLGLNGADELLAREWERLRARGQSLGFSRLIEPIERVATELARKNSVRDWKSETARAALLQVTVSAQVFASQIKIGV